MALESDVCGWQLFHIRVLARVVFYPKRGTFGCGVGDFVFGIFHDHFGVDLLDVRLARLPGQLVFRTEHLRANQDRLVL